MTQLKEHPGSCFSEGTRILCDCHQGLFCCTVSTGSHEPLRNNSSCISQTGYEIHKKKT